MPDKGRVSDLTLGFLVHIKKGDRIRLHGEYDTDDHKVLEGSFSEEDGWRFSIERGRDKNGKLISPTRRGR